MKKKIALITGSTSGIGKAAAFALGNKGFDLILTGRNEQKGNAVKNKINKLYNVRVDFIKADISSIHDVKTLADQVINRYDHLDVLINNAGALIYKYKKSKEEIELTFATNYLGHFLLTLSLLKLLKNTHKARIINVSSGAHSNVSINLNNITNPLSYNRRTAYGQSKLAQILFTYQLSKKLDSSNITVNAVHPGGVKTNLGKNNGFYTWLKYTIYHLYNRRHISSQEAAEAMVYISTSNEVENITGKYFYLKEIVKSSDESYNLKLAEALWEMSLQLCGLDKSPIL